MKAAIENIMVMERIRKEITKIDELAEDIKQNGLLNAVTVMAIEGGELRLLAGLRRIKAAQLLGWTEIEVNVVTPANAEEALCIEISENEQREPFTFSERDYFRKLLEEVETAKAKERMSLGGRGGFEQGSPHGDTLQKGRVTSIVAEKLGMKKTTYDRAKYIAANASPEVIEQLDKGERTIRGTYDELKAKEKAGVPTATGIPLNAEPEIDSKEEPRDKQKEQSVHPFPKSPAHAAVTRTPRYRPYPSAQEEEALRKRREFDALSPEGKIAELQRQLREERVRANGAESDLEREKKLRHNEMFHYTATINLLKNQLAAANARIMELEANTDA